MRLSSVFSGVITAVVATTVTATPVSVAKRSNGEIVQALSVVSDNIAQLSDKLNGYDGGLIPSLEIQIQATKLASSLQDAVDSAKNSANLTEDESTNVAVTLLGLQPNINSVLDLIVSKKPEFDKAILHLIPVSWLVKADLKQEKDLAGQLGDALIPKLTSNYAQLAPLVNQQIADKFSEAIAAYS